MYVYELHVSVSICSTVRKFLSRVSQNLKKAQAKCEAWMHVSWCVVLTWIACIQSVCATIWYVSVSICSPVRKYASRVSQNLKKAKCEMHVSWCVVWIACIPSVCTTIWYVSVSTCLPVRKYASRVCMGQEVGKENMYHHDGRPPGEWCSDLCTPALCPQGPGFEPCLFHDTLACCMPSSLCWMKLNFLKVHHFQNVHYYASASSSYWEGVSWCMLGTGIIR